MLNISHDVKLVPGAEKVYPHFANMTPEQPKEDTLYNRRNFFLAGSALLAASIGGCVYYLGKTIPDELQTILDQYSKIENVGWRKKRHSYDYMFRSGSWHTCIP